MKLIKRIFLMFLLVLVTLGVVFVGVGYVNYRKAIGDVSIEAMVKQVESKPDYVTIDQISPDLLKATIAIEDRRFYDHHGVDYISLGRALVNNVFAKGIVGGGSTITQQLAKNLYFDYQPSYLRKMSEIFMAYDFDGKLEKDKLLELYVNVINYGDNHMGIAQASMGYFGKKPSELTLDEATLLAGLPQSPSNFQLSNHEREARVRQKQVLEAMVRDQNITSLQMQEIIGA